MSSKKQTKRGEKNTHKKKHQTLWFQGLQWKEMWTQEIWSVYFALKNDDDDDVIMIVFTLFVSVS